VPITTKDFDGDHASISATSASSTAAAVPAGDVMVVADDLMEIRADALVLFSYYTPPLFRMERGLGVMTFPVEMQVLEADDILSAEDIYAARNMTPGTVMVAQSREGNFRAVIIACVGERRSRKRNRGREDLFTTIARQSTTPKELLDLIEPILSAVLRRAENEGYRSIVLAGIPLPISEKLGEAFAAQSEWARFPWNLFRLSKDSRYCYSKTASWERSGFRTGINRWTSSLTTGFEAFWRALKVSVERSGFSGQAVMTLPGKATADDYELELTRRTSAANQVGTIILVMIFAAFPIAVIFEQIRQSLGVETLGPWTGIFWVLYGITLVLGVPTTAALFLSVAGMDQFADLKEDISGSQEQRTKRSRENPETRAGGIKMAPATRSEKSGRGGQIAAVFAVVAALALVAYGFADAMGDHGFLPPRGWEIVAGGVVLFFATAILGGVARRERWKGWREKFQTNGGGKRG